MSLTDELLPWFQTGGTVFTAVAPIIWFVEFTDAAWLARWRQCGRNL